MQLITRRTFIIGAGGLLIAGRARARPVILDINALFPQTKAIIAAFSPAPTGARIAIINSLVGSLLRSGAWGSFNVLYVEAAATLQNASINWINPSLYALVQVGSVTFLADRGVTSDGTTGYFTTGHTPSTAGGPYAQDFAHVGSWINSSAVTAGEELTINAADFTQSAAQFNARNTGGYLRGAVNDLTAVNLATPTSPFGHSGISRSGSNASQAFKTGAFTGTVDTTASVAIAAGNLFICGTPMYGLSLKTQGASHIGGGWSSAIVYSVNSAFFNYMRALGAA